MKLIFLGIAIAIGKKIAEIIGQKVFISIEVLILSIL